MRLNPPGSPATRAGFPVDSIVADIITPRIRIDTITEIYPLSLTPGGSLNPQDPVKSFNL